MQPALLSTPLQSTRQLFQRICFWQLYGGVHGFKEKTLCFRSFCDWTPHINLECFLNLQFPREMWRFQRTGVCPWNNLTPRPMSATLQVASLSLEAWLSLGSLSLGCLIVFLSIKLLWQLLLLPNESKKQYDCLLVASRSVFDSHSCLSRCDCLLGSSRLPLQNNLTAACQFIVRRSAFVNCSSAIIHRNEENYNKEF